MAGFLGNAETVSTHSRPKAAGCAQLTNYGTPCRFNSQPPEGGWPPAIITAKSGL